MRKILTLLLLSSYCVSSQAQTVYPSGVPNCIARWDFANSGTITTLADVSGNNNNGSVTNLTAANGFRNVPNHAMKFDGSTSFAVVPHTNLLQPTAITMVALVKFKDFYSGQCETSSIVTKNTPHHIASSYSLNVGDNTYDRACGVYSPNNMQVYSAYNANARQSMAPGNYIAKSSWYFIASSYDGDTIKYYSVLMDPNTYNSSVTPTSSEYQRGAIAYGSGDLSIGQTLYAQYPYWLNADMDELAIFNKALSSNEMQSIYDYLWGIVRISEPFNDTTLCNTSSFMLPYTVNNSSFFQTNNKFTAQLSDALGSFSSPIDIGSITSTTNGSIPCSINSIPAGSKYRIRIVADNVPYITADNGRDIVIDDHFVGTASITASATTLSQPNQLVTFTVHPVNCGSNPTYQWRLNNIDISGANADVWTGNINHNDVVSIRVTSNMECAEVALASDSIYMYNTSIETINSFESLTIAPNPSSGKFILNGIFLKDEEVHIAVYNITGQQVYSTKMHLLKGAFMENIELTNVANGFYHLRISSGDICRNMKVTINK